MSCVERFLAAVAVATGERPTPDPNGWYGRCPAHDDNRASLSVARGENGGVVIHCHAGCPTESIVKSVGLTLADLMPQRNGKHRVVATYDYRDESGSLLFQVVRFEPKDFRQRRPKDGGGWDWSVKGARVVPYHLLELLQDPSRPVVVVEGEKDVDNLAQLGVLATCNAGGAGKWTAEHAQHLKGRRIAIIPDKDGPGRKHAHQVATSLQGLAEWVRVIELPGPGKDASDWIAAGGTKEELRGILAAAPEWKPAAQSDAAHAPPIAPGTRVKALDRDNIGEVLADLGDACKVKFVSEAGSIAIVVLPKSQLRDSQGREIAVASGDESPAAEVWKSSDLIVKYPHLRPVVIDGLARRGETVNVVSISKAGKSWLGYSLLLSVATGRRWLETFECHQGRVLLIDNELHLETLSRRLEETAGAMGILGDGWRESLDVISLRGQLIDLHQLGTTIKAIDRDSYACVLADAWYRFLPSGVDENSNSDVAQLYNRIDEYAEHLGAVWVNIHHASKGNQSDKSVTDVGSGAGSQSRAADSHLILRPHEKPDVVVLEAAVRSFPPFGGVSLRWQYPLWSIASDADPKRLRRKASEVEERQKERDEDGKGKIIAKLAGGAQKTARQLRDTGLSAGRLERLIAVLMHEERLVVSEKESRGKIFEVYSLIEKEDEKQNDPVQQTIDF